MAWHGGDPLRLRAADALWLRDIAKPLWWTYLADSRTLYVQYNEVRGGIDGVADEILARAKQADVDRVVVDLRNNGGGDNTTYRHLLDVIQDPAIDRPGRLDVLIGRLTFSAAANFATELEATTSASFVGEAMGGSPNLYGDARPTDLPYGGQVVYVASRYWQMSTADDARITIEPEPRDPVLVGGLPGRSRPGPRRGDGRDAGRRGARRYPRAVTESPDLLITGGTVVTAGGSRRADLAVAGGRISAIELDLGGLRERRARRSTRPGCSSFPARSTSTPIRASRPTPIPTASSRTPSPPRSVARRRSCRSTTRGPGRRPPRNGRCSPGSASGGRRPTATARSTSG